jgi:hypothetical protein
MLTNNLGHVQFNNFINQLGLLLYDQKNNHIYDDYEEHNEEDT